MIGNQTEVLVGDNKVTTLRDILPDQPGLSVLFVAKTPAPKSVEIGHYFQGKQGTMFWNRLREYGLMGECTGFEDDELLNHEFGITDIVKVPRGFGDEPSDREYRAGMSRILDLIRLHRPRVVVFVYKRVLDQLLRLAFGIREKSRYGFNSEHDVLFGCRVFAFPMPGTPCTTLEAVAAMNGLASMLSRNE